MNLQTEISQELWTAVADAYNAKNYSHSILEAVHHLTALLRERSGLDGDGASLAGQALGGDSPRLRVNTLATETERDVQRGLEQIVRGVYVAIRNPRSHEQIDDSKKTADAVILFVDYLGALLKASQPAFTPAAFVQCASDPEFVDSERYAELLVAEIPPLRRGEAMLALYDDRARLDMTKVRNLIRVLIGGMGDSQLAAYLTVVSEELRTATEDAAIRTTLQMLIPELWGRVSEVARLRIENKLIGGIKEGEILRNGRVTQALATWSRRFLKFFDRRAEVARVLVQKLEDEDPDDRHFVAKYFMSELPEIIPMEGLADRCIRAIVSAVRGDDENVRSALIAYVRSYPEIWQKKLAAALTDQTDPSNPAVVLPDGTPLLSSPAQDELSEADIPF